MKNKKVLFLLIGALAFISFFNFQIENIFFTRNSLENIEALADGESTVKTIEDCYVSLFYETVAGIVIVSKCPTNHTPPVVGSCNELLKIQMLLESEELATNKGNCLR